MSEKRRIVVVKCAGVAFEGTVSFRFMFDAKIPNDKLLLHDPWGMLKYDRDGDEESCSLSLFRGGQGLVYGGGFGKGDEDDWVKRVLGELPSCTILAGPRAFEFWAAVCAKHGVEYEVHEYDGLLRAG